MVSLPLIQHLAAAIDRLRGRRPIAWAGFVILASCVGLIVWKVVDRHLASLNADQPSLEDLINQVGEENDSKQKLDQPPSPATRAPRSRSWTSPLAHQCEGGDPSLLQHLEGLRKRSSTWRRSVAIDPTNFGERLTRDAFDRPLDASPRVIVLHETVYGMASAINTFQTPHPRDEDQVSYHT